MHNQKVVLCTINRWYYAKVVLCTINRWYYAKVVLCTIKRWYYAQSKGDITHNQKVVITHNQRWYYAHHMQNNNTTTCEHRKCLKHLKVVHIGVNIYSSLSLL